MKFGFFQKIIKSSLLEWILATFIAGVLFFITLWLIVTFYLPYYTRHGKEVEVPYVIGLEKDKAAQIMTENKLRYTFLGRGLYVIKTVPEPGTIVKEGRKVKLTLSDKLPEQ